MEEETPWHKRVSRPDHPDRCQAISSNGDQCWFVRLGYEGGDTGPGPGESTYCQLHGSFFKVKAKKEAKRLYALEKYRERLDRLGDEAFQANLDEELGIQRMLLEELMQRFEGVELITQSGRVTQIVKEIRETMSTNRKLKSQMGELLDRSALAKLCDAIVGIVQKHVPADRMSAVADEVAGAVAQAVASRSEAPI